MVPVAVALLGFAHIPGMTTDLLAQQRPPGEHVIQVTNSFRILTPQQNPRFTPRRGTSYTVHVVGRVTDATSGDVTWDARLASSSLIDSMRLSTRADGRVSSASARARMIGGLSLRQSTAGDSAPNDMSYVDRNYGLVTNVRVIMPAARLWNLIPVVPVTAMRAGMIWTDTLAFSAAERGFSQSYAGTRQSIVRRDTTLEGRTMWIIDDSTSLRVNEGYLEQIRSLAARAPVARRLTGFVRGRYIFDPQSRFYYSRSDTTSLAGDAVITWPDGRTFSTPVRIEEQQS